MNEVSVVRIFISLVLVLLLEGCATQQIVIDPPKDGEKIAVVYAIDSTPSLEYIGNTVFQNRTETKKSNIDFRDLITKDIKEMMPNKNVEVVPASNYLIENRYKDLTFYVRALNDDYINEVKRITEGQGFRYAILVVPFRAEPHHTISAYVGGYGLLKICMGFSGCRNIVNNHVAARILDLNTGKIVGSSFKQYYQQSSFPSGSESDENVEKAGLQFIKEFRTDVEKELRRLNFITDTKKSEV